MLSVRLCSLRNIYSLRTLGQSPVNTRVEGTKVSAGAGECGITVSYLAAVRGMLIWTALQDRLSYATTPGYAGAGDDKITP